MSFFRDFLNLCHEWTATDDEDFFVNCGAQDDESVWAGSDESFGASETHEESRTFNLATGLPMLTEHFDVGGNPYGVDLEDDSSITDDWPDRFSDPW